MPAPSQKKSSTTFEYRGSLLRIFVIGLLALSLLPLITINAFNYLGMRRMLKDQTTSQLTLAVENYTSDYQNYASRRRDTLHDILTRPDLRDSLLELIRTSADTSEYAHMEARLRDQLKLELKSPSEELFSSILLLDTDGDVVVSTRPELEFYSFRYNGLPAVIGSSRSIALYNPAPVLNNDLALFTSEVLVDERTGFTYTLVGVSKSEYPRMLLDQAEKFFNGSNAYLFTRNNIVIGLNADGALARSPNSQEQSSFLEALIKSSETKQSVSYVSQGEIPVLSYARWIPSLSVGFVVEVPEATVYEQTRFMGLFLLLIMLVSILSTGFLFYFGLRNIIRPLKNLATSVQRFTEGEWTHRVKMGKSGDEIGLLGFTFNRMADELSKLY
ncbi:MAG TPA: HAMP domain-containing protein, partial [Anaerolineaceae bacterium]|nr:HAMP domain-containing protein [Anaerolineaceae bacterium]